MKLKPLLATVLTVAGCTFLTGAAKAQSNFNITFYSNNGATGSGEGSFGDFKPGTSDIPVGVAYYPLPLYQLANLKDYRRDPAGSFTSLNDRAHSAKIFAPAGLTFVVYDHPNGSTGEDYVEIYVKKATYGYGLWNFEKSFEDEFLRVTYYKKGGESLDGQVSAVIVRN